MTTAIPSGSKSTTLPPKKIQPYNCLGCNQSVTVIYMKVNLGQQAVCSNKCFNAFLAKKAGLEPAQSTIADSAVSQSPPATGSLQSKVTKK